jgi:hypothetical protein
MEGMRLAVVVAVGTVALALAAFGCASGGGGRPAASARQTNSAACAAPAADPAQVVNANRPAQDPQLLQGVVAGVCLSDVLDRIGPAHRYVAATPFQFEWKATDGRTFQVGVPSLRDRVLYARWAK